LPNGRRESPILSYEAVDVGLIEPRKRDYTSGKAKSAVAQQAEKSGLPVPDGAAQVPTPYTEQKPQNVGREATWVKDGEKIAEGESFSELKDKERKERQ
jgi:hypothetical protein